MSNAMSYDTTFLNGKIGSYQPSGRAFIAQKIETPNYKSSPKFTSQDVSQSRIALIFYTDRGTFIGPPIQSAQPSWLGDAREREFTTVPVKFDKPFSILNVIAADLENQFLIRPIEKGFPIFVAQEDPELLAFQFRFGFFV